MVSLPFREPIDMASYLGFRSLPLAPSQAIICLAFSDRTGGKDW
jgi:hypothetical protein